MPDRRLWISGTLLIAGLLLGAAAGCSEERPGPGEPFAFDWPVPMRLPVDFRWDRFGEVITGRFHLELAEAAGIPELLELRSVDLELESIGGQPAGELPVEQRAPLEAIARSQLPNLRLSRAGEVQEVLGVRESQQAIVEAAREAGADEATLAELERRTSDASTIASLERGIRELWGHLVADYVDLDLEPNHQLRRRREVATPAEERVLSLETFSHLGTDGEHPGCVRLRRKMQLNQEEAEHLALEKVRSWITRQDMAGGKNATFLDSAYIFRIDHDAIASIREVGLQPYRLYREITTVIEGRQGERLKLEEKYDYLLRWPQS